MLQYLRSNTFGLGKVGCWMDDNKSVLTILDGQWGKSTTCTISCMNTRAETNPLQTFHTTSDRESSPVMRLFFVAYTDNRRSGTVAKGLPAGEHHLHCQLIEGKEFRIIALMTYVPRPC